MTDPVRAPWRITLAVWHALLLREAVARLFGKRAALVWLLLEPLAWIGLMVVLFAIVRAHVIGGMEASVWLATGLLAYVLFRRTATQGAQAVGANLALYTYRQVLPVDTVMVRCLLEALLMVLTATLVLVALALAGAHLRADDALLCASAALGLWWLAVGWALTVSVGIGLVPEAEKLPGLLMMPLMFVSGTVMPLSVVPLPWRGWLMLNPVAHGVEGVRAGLSSTYHHVPELSLAYLHGWALVLVFLGLALHVRLRNRLVAL